MNPIEKYFAGERGQCSVGLLISLIFIAVSVYFIYQPRPMLRGIAYSVIPLSLIILSICTAIVIRTPKDIQRISHYFRSEPLKMQSEELPRMEKVIKSFILIKKIEIGVIVVGIIMILFFWKNELLRGVGVGLLISAALLYLFDTLAESRGEEYISFLKTLR